MKTKTLDLDKLKSKDPKVKYGFTKELLKLGMYKLGLLYDYFDYWIELLNSENNILVTAGPDCSRQWSAPGGYKIWLAFTTM